MALIAPTDFKGVKPIYRYQDVRSNSLKVLNCDRSHRYAHGTTVDDSV